MVHWLISCHACCHRGKLLNVRDATAAQISDNAEIQNIKQILGLQHGKVRYPMHVCTHSSIELAATVQQLLHMQCMMPSAMCHAQVYEDTKALRYGHLMIMTDQDHDGSHIKGLIMNFLHHFYPSLLRIPGFLVEFITPIIKVRQQCSRALPGQHVRAAPSTSALCGSWQP